MSSFIVALFLGLVIVLFHRLQLSGPSAKHLKRFESMIPNLKRRSER